MTSIILLLIFTSILLGWYFYYVTFSRELLDFWESCDYYYKYNEKYNILDPTVKLQEKRFNYDRMFDLVRRQDEEPANLDKYRIGGNTTGIFEKWNSDHVALGDMGNWLIECACFYFRKENNSERRELCLNIMHDFVPRWETAMEGKYDGWIPWESI